ncbi:hypothetical protein GO594_07300 [Pseudomonas otitidis]|uniref:Uncharacterized protein n=1 Tax=Metapseudomonas otitidis TaxID=319939 RepID=A0A7X3KSR2_9GAMM|nr:hypothetical protein [Pseudomonas otitidis]MWK55775.1 hypothetical protein [Pseudomonas otitidis]
MSSFQLLIRCGFCDGLCKVGGHSSRFYNRWPELSTCPHCGSTQALYDSVERWISQAVWWNPLSWRRGYWEKAGTST